MDMISYVGFKNLLIGAALFLALKTWAGSGHDKRHRPLSCCPWRWPSVGACRRPPLACARATIWRPSTTAQPGDVIEVARGQYRANLLIDKPLTLRGLDRPTISGGNQGDTIRVTAPDVLIEGLIVRDSGRQPERPKRRHLPLPGAHRAVVRHCDLTYNLFGLVDRESRTTC